MWSMIVSKLLGSFSEKVADVYLEKVRLKSEIKLEVLRGKAAYERAKTERAAQSEGRDHEWELESIRNSGWKDEFVMLVLSIPMVLVFIPWTQPFIKVGFENLEGTPDWYRWLVVMIYAATFGIRIWRRKL